MERQRNPRQGEKYSRDKLWKWPPNTKRVGRFYGGTSVLQWDASRRHVLASGGHQGSAHCLAASFLALTLTVNKHCQLVIGERRALRRRQGAPANARPESSARLRR